MNRRAAPLVEQAGGAAERDVGGTMKAIFDYIENLLAACIAAKEAPDQE